MAPRRFVLVHGAMYGAWCWSLLTPWLERRGAEVVTVELPGHGERRAEVPTLRSYRQAVVDVLRPADVLVGHSMGCVVATMAADQFPAIGHLMLLGGRLPIEGRHISDTSHGPAARPAGSLRDPSGADPLLKVTEDGQYVTLEPADATWVFFHDSPPDVAAWACQRLTPQRIDVFSASPVSVPAFWASDPPRSFILCDDDRALPEAMAREHARRLGVEPLHIATSHSPFFSRPEELAGLMFQALDTVPTGPLCPR